MAIPVALAAQDNDPPARAGRVSSVAGTVAFQAAGTPDWSTAPLNYTVSSGDRLLTHQRSRAEIEVGPFDVRLADSTDLSVVNLTDDFTQLGLNRGTIRVSVYRLASSDSMEVDTPNGAIIIRSAGRYRVDVLEGVSTIVSVEEGTVELSGPALDYTVRRGQSVELTGTNAISANMIQHPRNTDFDQWSSERDRRQEQSSCSRYMSRDIPGCADLDYNGRWEYQASYGYVWRPTIVTVGWVPYRYGRWVWTGNWGYTWVEASPWGFAPFHYGRWVVVGNSWLWAPGPIVRRPYYAPALVVFVGGPRYGHGRYHQAWFPLGYHEPYYPRYRHSDRYLRQVNIANVRNITNVDDFVDPRRAERLNYTNRQATTVVSTDAFGRRPVVHEAANVQSEEINRAPIIRDRWETPRLASQVADQTDDNRQSPFRARREATTPQTSNEPNRVVEPGRIEPRRVAEPTRSQPETQEPRSRSPLIYRNAPPAIDRRRTASPDGSERPAPSGEVRSRQGIEAGPSPMIDRGRPSVRRSTPAGLPSSGGSAERPRPARTIERSSPPPDRASSRPSNGPQRVAAPRGRAPSSAGSGGAQRLPSRRSGKRPA